MKVEVNNFMGCEKAEVSANNIALICGLNHQGKSSFLNALISAVGHNPTPFGLKKSECGLLVKSGKASASVKVYDERSFESVSINWPKCEMTTEGKNPPTTSEISCGLSDLVTMKDKERSEFIRSLMNCEPTKEDLKNFLSSRDCNNEKLLEAVWKYIEQDGFEASYKRATDSGRAFKNQWSDVTGETYGTNKAETWQPTDWNSELIGISQESLEAQLSGARAELEDMIARQAVDASKIEEYQELASETFLQVARDEADNTCANIATLKKEISNLKYKLDNLKKTDKNDIQICPHCGKNLVVYGGKIDIAEEVSPEQIEKIKQIRTDLLQSILVNEGELEKLQTQYNNFIDEIKRRKEAFSKLEELKRRSGGNVSQADIDQKRNQIKQIEANIEAFKAYNEARRLANKIKENQIVIDALDMSGIRKSAMEKGLSQFNSYLKQTCEIAGWGIVAVEKDLAITYNDRPYLLLSESEKMRVKITLQYSITKLNGSNIIIIDGAELLDKNGKNGLFKLLISSDLFCFVGMMYSDPAKVPDLKKYNVSNYWVENGIIKEI